MDGDKLAGFRIALLVAANAGGSKVGEGIPAVIGATFMLIGKKVGILIFVAVGDVWMVVKRLFAGREARTGR